jgi:uncharacterized protein YjbK
MTHDEVEAKLELTAAEFDRLLNAGRLVQKVDILNVYYDTRGALCERAATFRVRHTAGGGTEATLKIPKSQAGCVRTASETTWNSGRLPPQIDLARDVPGNCRQVLNDFGLRRLDRVGWMRTLRLVVDLAVGAAVELDRVRLPGGDTVYEVEVESEDPDTLHAAVRKILALAPSARHSTLSKYERLAQAVASRSQYNVQGRES